LKPWLKKQWCLPGKPSAEFVCAMEDVLDVYKRPYDPRRPVVCVDEKSKQLVGEVRRPLPPRPGQPALYDHEYQRHGTANLFMVVEPLRGWRHVQVTERRTKVDWAHLIKQVVEVLYPEAERIVLIQDNLNTHDKSSLYEAFPPQEAKRIADQLEIHRTPNHGSWLDMAEIELSVLSRQCLQRRIPDMPTLKKEVTAWLESRATDSAPINWHFTTEDARIKLRELYPSFSD
jgi:hypothetical protein